MRFEDGVEAVYRHRVYGLSGVGHVSDAGQVQLRLRIQRQKLAGRQAVGEIGCLQSASKHRQQEKVSNHARFRSK